MAEGDNIVIGQLRSSVGIDLDDDFTLGDIDAPLFYKSCVACFTMIDPDTPLDPLLPKNTASKFAASTKLADALKAAGYTEDLDFNNFLYPVIAKVRSVLSWLVMALPQADAGEGEGEGATGRETIYEKANRLIQTQADATLQAQKRTKRRLLRKVTADECAEFVPPEYVQPHSTKPLNLFNAPKAPLACSQLLDPREFPSSMLEYNCVQCLREKWEADLWNNDGITSGKNKAEWRQYRKDRFLTTVKISKSIAAEPVFEVQESRTGEEKKEAKKKEEEEPEVDEEMEAHERVKKLKDREEKVRQEIASVEASLQSTEAEIAEIENNIEASKQEMDQNEVEEEQVAKLCVEMEAQYETMQKTMEYAGDLEGNRKRLSSERAESEKEIADIQAQFEAKQEEYKKRYEEKKGEKERARKRFTDMVDEVASLKARRKNLGKEMEEKERQHQQLTAELEKLPKDIDREVFISRIMDIIKNIKKQQNEVTKINIDNRELQKEINGANEAVTRSFVAIDEKIYKDTSKESSKGSKGDNVAKSVYKQLVNLREAFDKLIDTVEQTGNLKAREHDLEEKKSKLATRNDALNKAQLEQDLGSVRSENKALQDQIKAIKEG